MAMKLCSGVLLSGCFNKSVTNEIFHFIIDNCWGWVENNSLNLNDNIECKYKD